MRKYATALLLASAPLISVWSPALAQATNDIDVIEARQQSRERASERIAEAREQRGEVGRSEAPQQQQPAPVFQQQPAQVFQQQPQEQPREVFAPRQPRVFDGGERQGNVEVRGDRGDRNFPPQGNVEVRRDDGNRGGFDRRFEGRGQDGGNRGAVLNTSPQAEVRGANRADGRQVDGRRFDRSDGQRFGRNEEYRSNRDNDHRFDHNNNRHDNDHHDNDHHDNNRFGGNWSRGGDGHWQRHDSRFGFGFGLNRNYGYGNGYNSGHDDHQWNRDWRSDRRYDWHGYRSSNRNSYHLSPYYDPFGSRYGYQRFSIGIRLNSFFYSDRYWISDPYAYRLPYVDGSYRWVRYYNDVLLVDLRTGYVVDMINDFFW